MGWASGSELAELVWDDVRKHIPKEKRKTVARKVIKHFEDMDCDTINECEQLVIDAEKEKYYWGDE